MTGPQLKEFCTELNGGDSIGDTLLSQLLNVAKATVEQRRPWMILRSTDTSVNVTASVTDGWNTGISLAGIERLNRFFGEYPVRLFDGNNTVEQYRLIPFQDRLNYREAPSVFAYDVANKTLYLSGRRSVAGTLWIQHLKDTPDVDLTDASSTWAFPSWSHPLLGFMAVAMHKGGVDYDDINARMAPENRAQAEQIIRMLENWDTEMQLSVQSHNDPTGFSEGPRANAIDIY